MTILSAQSIRFFAREEPSIIRHPDLPMIKPFTERAVHEPSGTSYGLSSAGYDVRLAHSLFLPPWGFKLAYTLEQLAIPTNIAVYVKDKSTLARRGVAVQNTYIDPGFRGYLMLEITNHTIWPIWFIEGQPIAQLIFHALNEHTDSPYAGKYQDQKSGITGPLKEPKK